MCVMDDDRARSVPVAISDPGKPTGAALGVGSAPVRTLRRLARRREPGLVLLEGPRVVAEAVACAVHLELLAVGEGVTFDAPAERRVTLGTRALQAVSQTVTPQGVLAIGRHREARPDEAVLAARRVGWPLLVLDGIQDPGNVGTICRSAAAAGAPAVVVVGGGADPFGPKAVRASAGNVFRLTVARGAWPDLDQLGGYGAMPSGGVRPEDIDLGRAQVLALGGEAHGLRRQDLEPVSIPMTRGVESLNVAAAAAVLLFEIRRKLAK
jgi:TrmH family RNA methyltransferase